MHSSPNWRVDRARESLLLPILNFASTAFLICSLQSSFFSLRCLLPSELLLSAVFFYQIQNWKLIRIIIKILKEGIFYFILIMQASCLLSHFVKSLYFVRKKIPTFWYTYFQLNSGFGMKKHFLGWLKFYRLGWLNFKVDFLSKKKKKCLGKIWLLFEK